MKNDGIVVYDRKRDALIHEKVYKAAGLAFLYGDGIVSRTVGALFRKLIVGTPFFSWLYGCWQRTRWSCRNIANFVKAYDVDLCECEKSLEEYHSFNDFFIRRLKGGCRSFSDDKDEAIIPADGRYRFVNRYGEKDSFIIKDQAFDLEAFLQDRDLARQYVGGTVVLARLAPSDYHRFHFPCDCVPGVSRLINGSLYSVNPIAVSKKLSILWENKRSFCLLESEVFGSVLYAEIGATCVGTIRQTYKPGVFYSKGDEKGFFSFGGSALLLAFQSGKLTLDGDLSHPPYETLCRFGDRLGIKSE